LRIAVSDSCASGQGLCVGSVGAVGVLDGAGSLESSTLTNKGVTVDSEWAGSGGGDDGRSSATESSGEGLDVG